MEFLSSPLRPVVYSREDAYDNDEAWVRRVYLVQAERKRPLLGWDWQHGSHDMQPADHSGGEHGSELEAYRHLQL